MLHQAKLLGLMTRELQTDLFTESQKNFFYGNGYLRQGAPYSFSRYRVTLKSYTTAWVTNPIYIQLLAAIPLKARLFSMEALQTRLLLHQEACGKRSRQQMEQMAWCLTRWLAVQRLERQTIPSQLFHRHYWDILFAIIIKSNESCQTDKKDKTINLFINLKSLWGKGVWTDKQNYHPNSYHLSPGTHVDSWLQIGKLRMWNPWLYHPCLSELLYQTQNRAMWYDES